MDFLPRWKTTLGAIGSILIGIGLGLRILLSEDGIDWDRLMEAGAMISLGLAAFGIGKKIERKG